MKTCKMIRSFFVMCIAIFATANCHEIHKFMTPEEVMSVFHTTHDAVPKYDIIPVQHRPQGAKLSVQQFLQLKAFNKELQLYLEPTEGILAGRNTPVWTVESNPNAPEGLEYNIVPGAMDHMGVLLHDIRNLAAITVERTPTNKLIFDGTIGKDLVLRSLPHRVIHEVIYGKNGLYEPHYAKNNTGSDDLVYTYHHVVYEKPKLKGKLADKDFVVPDIAFDHGSRAKRNAPDVIYPQMLIVVDYNEYKIIGRSLERATRYVVSFWNGVDLRYRMLNNPRIRFNIAGIIIATDSNALPYIENNRIDAISVEADRALRNMSMYFYRENRFPPELYDMVVTMTQLDMCNIDYFGYCDPGTLGYAFVAGACDWNGVKKNTERAGIVEDNGGFSGIIPAAHEVGHLIGARHDGNMKSASDCPPDEGFIMTSELQLSENGFEWSNCTIHSFYKFLNEDRAQCLYNSPPPDRKIPRILPGKLMSLDAQCKKVYGTKACKYDASVCTALECVTPGKISVCAATAAAAEGSPCGDGLFCLNGKCVVEGPETIDQGSNIWNMINKPLIKKQQIRPFRKIVQKLLPFLRKKFI